ncbi:hypothetical protein AB0M72_06785 [Nocardiopsis dassonvillei]
MSMQWHPQQDAPHVVQAGRDLLVVPSLDLQCVARTRQRQRCKNGIISNRGGDLHDQDRPAVLWSTRGLLPVWRTRNTTEEVRMWTEQRCSVHETPEATDHTAPEWYRFDPDRDTAFIRPFPPLPRMPTPPQHWTRASWELTQLWEIGEGKHHGRPAGAFTTPGWDLEPAPASPTTTALAALEQILARHHDLPALDWALTCTGELVAILPQKPVTDRDERHQAFTDWVRHLRAERSSQNRGKGYLHLRARTGDDALVPVLLQVDIDDGIA